MGAVNKFKSSKAEAASELATPERLAVLLTKGVPQSVIRLLSGDENETVRNLAEQRLSKVPAES